MNKAVYSKLPVLGPGVPDGVPYTRNDSILIFCESCSGCFECDDTSHYNQESGVHTGDRGNELRCSRFIESTDAECGGTRWGIRPAVVGRQNLPYIRRYRNGH